MRTFAKALAVLAPTPNHEISQMIMKVITPEVVSLPSAVMDAMFDQSTRIGEFDDIRFEKGYENTIQVFDAIPRR